MALNPTPDKLAGLLESVEAFVPTVPDELTQRYLKLGGYDCQDKRLVRLVSVAAQQFVANVAHDALQIHQKRRSIPEERQQLQGYDTKDKRAVLTTEDLAEALRAYDVNVEVPIYFTNQPTVPPKPVNPLKP